MSECPHFGRELDFPTECTICSGADRKLKREQAKQGRTFPAKYPGWCHVCRNGILDGEMIYWAEGERAIHDECAP